MEEGVLENAACKMSASLSQHQCVEHALENCIIVWKKPWISPFMKYGNPVNHQYNSLFQQMVQVRIKRSPLLIIKLLPTHPIIRHPLDAPVSCLQLNPWTRLQHMSDHGLAGVVRFMTIMKPTNQEEARVLTKRMWQVKWRLRLRTQMPRWMRVMSTTLQI